MIAGFIVQQAEYVLNALFDNAIYAVRNLTDLLQIAETAQHLISDAAASQLATEEGVSKGDSLLAILEEKFKIIWPLSNSGNGFKEISRMILRPHQKGEIVRQAIVEMLHEALAVVPDDKDFRAQAVALLERIGAPLPANTSHQEAKPRAPEGSA